MKTWRFFRCAKCGHVEEAPPGATYVSHPCPKNRGWHVELRPEAPEPKETNP